MALLAGSVEEGPSKGTMASASTSVWEKAVPPSLLNNLFPPCMSLASLKLLPQSWISEQMSLRESVHRLFKRNT